MVLFTGKTMRCIPKRIEGEVLTKWCYINSLPLPLPLLGAVQHSRSYLLCPFWGQSDVGQVTFYAHFRQSPTIPLPFCFT